MKVKSLVEKLLQMPQEADVWVSLRQSKNGLNIDTIKKVKMRVGGNIEPIMEVTDVVIALAWRDFELDEDELYFCEKELDEEARDNYYDSLVDKELGK